MSPQLTPMYTLHALGHANHASTFLASQPPGFSAPRPFLLPGGQKKKERTPKHPLLQAPSGGASESQVP